VITVGSNATGAILKCIGLARGCSLRGDALGFASRCLLIAHLVEVQDERPWCSLDNLFELLDISNISHDLAEALPVHAHKLQAHLYALAHALPRRDVRHLHTIRSVEVYS